jgi:dihydrofolate reductase
MPSSDSRVTIHMVASLDGFVARKDGRVDWLDTADEFAGGQTIEPSVVETFLAGIDCYVMGSRTYETAVRFETQGHGWAYGEKPTFVLTHRELPRTRATVEFYAGDLTHFVNARLRSTFRNIWFVGGGIENTLSMFGLFGPGWYLRTEYRYAQYSNEALPEINLYPASVLNFKPAVQTITTEVLYKFNWM